MTEERLQWLRGLIAKNNLHDFYSSGEWQALAARAREEQHNECQRCKKRGWYAPCEAVHHRKRVKEQPELALEIRNLECLCRDCHEEEHVTKGYVNEEKW